MDSSKPVTKEDVEIETLKTFLRNEGMEFSVILIDPKKSEPTDIRYNNINYQVTIGDKEEVEVRRKVTSGGQVYTNIRNVTNIAPLLLSGTLTKKSIRSDSNTVLLIEVSSTDGLSWIDLESKISLWTTTNHSLCEGWKAIYLVFNHKNIKLNY